MSYVVQICECIALLSVACLAFTAALWVLAKAIKE